VPRLPGSPKRKRRVARAFPSGRRQGSADCGIAGGATEDLPEAQRELGKCRLVPQHRDDELLPHRTSREYFLPDLLDAIRGAIGAEGQLGEPRLLPEYRDHKSLAHSTSMTKRKRDYGESVRYVSILLSQLEQTVAPPSVSWVSDDSSRSTGTTNGFRIPPPGVDRKGGCQEYDAARFGDPQE
jgi:hypothetical protein